MGQNIETKIKEQFHVRGSKSTEDIKALFFPDNVSKIDIVFSFERARRNSPNHYTVSIHNKNGLTTALRCRNPYDVIETFCLEDSVQWPCKTIEV